ncbi:hypothetical protein HMPREF3212_04633 [Citrobacter freundii]|nr:hypothetical protein HMPREF3212_04633 [Citrobacter freundii]
MKWIFHKFIVLQKNNRINKDEIIFIRFSRRTILGYLTIL